MSTSARVTPRGIARAVRGALRPVGGAATVYFSYPVGLVVLFLGVVAAVLSVVLGGAVSAVVSAALELLGAPEDRAFMPATGTDAGGEILVLLGAILGLWGTCILGLRVIMDMVGLTGSPATRSSLGLVRRVGLGTLVVGVVAFLLGGLLTELFAEDFLDVESLAGAFGSLRWIGGRAVLAGAAAFAAGIFIPRRYVARVEAMGWDKLGHRWLNRAALALVALGPIVWVALWNAAAVNLSLLGVALLGFGVAAGFTSRRP